MMKEIKITEEELQELDQIYLPESALERMLEKVQEQIIAVSRDTLPERREWWLRMGEKYELDLDKNHYSIDLIRGILKYKGLRK